MRTIRNRFAHLASLLIIIAAAACDNPVEPDDHPEAGGVVILDASTGAVLTMSTGAGAAFTQPLTLSVGQVREVRVKFLDADAPSVLARAFFPDADEGESLRAVIANSAIVSYDDHGDHGDFTGRAAGQTTVQFELRHGSHADFRSGALTVVVQ